MDVSGNLYAQDAWSGCCVFCEEPSRCYVCSTPVVISALVVLASSCVSTRATSTQRTSVAFTHTATWQKNPHRDTWSDPSTRTTSPQPHRTFTDLHVSIARSTAAYWHDTQNYPRDLSSDNAPDLYSEGYWVGIWSRIPGTLMEVFHEFSESLQANSRMILPVRQTASIRILFNWPVILLQMPKHHKIIHREEGNVFVLN